MSLSSIPHQDRFFFFFFNDTATTEIYTLSLHDALPISLPQLKSAWAKTWSSSAITTNATKSSNSLIFAARSEEHTSELQSQSNLVCRLLLEKKKSRQQSWSQPTTPR